MARRHLQLDGSALRVLAHPLRARLLSHLRMHGAATATTLAERLATNTGATSYHLRKLAEVGLVAETGEGTGKQRFWAAAQESHSWSEHDVQHDPDAQAASSWLRQHYWQQFAERVVGWEELRKGWPVEWQAAAGMSDSLMDLTAAELHGLMDELNAVLLRYRDRTPSPGARQVVLNLYAMPSDPTDVP